MHLVYDQVSRNYTKPKTDTIFVFIFMKSCPYCVEMFGEWNRFKRHTDITTATIDNTLLNELKQKDPLFHTVNPVSYPHLQIVTRGPNTRSVLYNGPRTAAAFEQFSKTIVSPGPSKAVSKSKAVTKTKSKASVSKTKKNTK